MSIPTTCQACGNTFQVKDEFAGIKAKCSECGAVVQVPLGPSAGVEHPAVPESRPKSPAPVAKPAVAASPPRAAKPPVARDSSPSIQVAAPLAPKKPAPAAPTAAAAPAVRTEEPTPAASTAAFSAPLIDVGPREPTGAARTAGHLGHGRRKAQNPNMVLIAMIGGLAIALLGAVTLGALYLSGALGGRQQVAKENDGANWVVKPSAPVTPVDTSGGTVNPGGQITPVDPGARPVVDKGPIDYENGFKLDDVVYVRNMDDIERAIVKFEIPLKTGVGMKFGTGFFVDERGWVATNYHVIEDMTSDARVTTSSRDSYKIEGIIAQAKERDLAVVKLLDKPFQIMLMDIQSYQAEPARGEEVFSFGHPLGNDFSLTRGIVSRVLTSGELQQAHPGHLLASVNSPANQVWIQHDSKISPGNSGGPLFNKQCQVMGVNSFVHAVADFGFASHVRHLRDMVKEASGQVTPLEQGRNIMPEGDTLQPNLAAAEMEKLFTECKGFDWSPANAEQYAKMVRLAGGIATAAGADDSVATSLFGQLRNTDWTEAQITATNKLAANQVNRVNQGIFVFAKVLAMQGSALLLQIADTENILVVLNVPSEMSGLQKDNKLLLLGLITEQTGMVGMKGDPSKGQQEPIYGRMVNSRHMAKLN